MHVFTGTISRWAMMGTLAALAACSSDDSGQVSPVDPDGGLADGAGPGPGPGSPGTLPDGGPAPGGAGATKAADIAKKLRGKSNFLIGMGNDLDNDHNKDGAYTLGVGLDLHYAYLVGINDGSGWPSWNANGTFINLLTDSADAHGVTPMFSMYGMAAWGEGNISVATNNSFMTAYWSAAKLLFQRLAVFGKPAVVHFEPDWWAFAQQQSPDGSKQALVTIQPECAGIANTIAGMGQCLVKLARTISPKVVIGFHSSEWGGTTAATISFLKAVGADKADFIAVDMLDRDAGCFEAHVDPNCQRSAAGMYWDETNAKSPTFHEHIDWAKQIGAGIGMPVLWWQVPFGVPSSTPGGTAGHYRDNRVHYIFSHISEFAAAGGLGAVFGTGAGNQTYITTDGGQFKNAATAYFANPVALP